MNKPFQQTRILAIAFILLLANMFLATTGSAQIITANTAWSAIAPTPTSATAIIVKNGAVLTVDVSDAVCASIQLGDAVTAPTGNGTLVFNAASKVTVSGNVTLGNAPATGSLDMTAGGTLEIGGGGAALTAPALGTFTRGTGTINYNGAGTQTVFSTTYNNLTLSGSSAKTTTGVTVNGILSMEGTATASAAPTYGASATLQYNTATPRTTGLEWITPFIASGGVVIANTGTITLDAAKQVGNNSTTPLTINSLATLSTSASNYTLTLHGNFINNGTLSAGSSAITIAGTAAQSIAGFSTTGNVTMAKTGGIATLAGNVGGNGLTISGSGGTLNLGVGLTHTFTGTWTRTAGTLNGGSSLLRIGGGFSGTSGTFTAGTGTVEWNAAGPQVLAVVNYNNLVLSGNGSKSGAVTNVAGNYTLSGTVTNSTAASLSIGGNLNIGDGTGFTITTTLTVTGSTTVGGGTSGSLTISTTSGTKTFSGLVTINSGGTWDNTANEDVAFAGGITNNGTFNAGTGGYTFQTNAQALTGILAIPDVTVSIVLTNNNSLTNSTRLAGSGTLVQAPNAFLSIGDATPTPLINASALGNTVNYTGTGQSVKVTPYHHLILSGGSKTLGANTTVAGDLTLTGAATATTGAALNIGGNLSVGAGTTFATGSTSTFTLNVSGVTSVSGTLTLANIATKTFTGNVTINNGGTWNETGTGAINYSGNLVNNGSYTGNTGTHSFSGISSISGANPVNIPNASFSGTTTNSGILTTSTSLSGAGSLVNDATGVLNFGGSSIAVNLITSAAGNVVNYNGAGQTILAQAYYNLVLSGSGTKLFPGATIINNDLSINSGVAANLGAFTSSANSLTLNGNGQLSGSWGGTGSGATYINTTYFAAAAGILNVANTNCVAGTWIGATSTDWNNGANWCGGVPTSSTNVVIPPGGNQPIIGAAAFCNNISISSGASLTISGANTLTVSGNWTNAGTFTANTSTVNFAGSAAQAINNGQAFSNLTIANTGGVGVNSVSLTAPVTTSGSLVMSSGILNLAGQNITAGSLQGSASITSNTAGTATITAGGNNATTTYSGIISNGTNPGTMIVAFTKAGTGVLTLSGNSSYSGATTISGGTLSINTIADAGTNSAIGTGLTTPVISMTAATSVLQYTGTGHTSNRVINLTIDGPTIDASGTGTLTLTGGVTGNTFNLNIAGTGNGIESGVIGTTTGTLTKNGPGIWTLPALNTYSGKTTINAGTLSINTLFHVSSGSSSLGAPTSGANGQIAIGSTAVLQYTGSGHIADRSINLTGSGATIEASGTGTLTIGGGISGSTFNLNITGTSDLILNGAITTTSGGLNKTGTGMLVLGGSNTYTGITSVGAGGILRLGTASERISNSSALVVDGTFDMAGFNETVGSLAGSGTVTNSVNGTSTLTAGGNNSSTTFSGLISNGPTTATMITAFTKAGSGTLTLPTLNSYSGATGISAGTLSINSIADAGINSAIGTGSSNPVISMGATAVLQYTGTGHASNRAISLTADGPTIDASGTGTLDLSGGITINGFNLVLTGSGTGIQSGAIGTGLGTLAKSGLGTWTLSGNNTYSNTTTLSAGTLNINSATALGTGTFTITGGTINNTSAGPVTLANNNVQNWNGNFIFTGTQNLNLGTGAITVNNNRTVTVSGGELTVGGIIGGSVRLTKDGPGMLTLNGLNTYNGFTLNAGTVNVNSAQALGNSVAAGGAFIVNGGTFDNTAASPVTTLNYVQTWNTNINFTGTNALNLGSGTISMGGDRTVNVNASTLTLGGTVSGAGFNLTKSGAGTLSFGSNAVNINDLNINAGTLVASSGSMNLTGNYSSTATFVPNGGTVAFTGTAVKTISRSGGEVFHSLAINKTGAGGLTLNDPVDVNGVLTLTAGKIATTALNILTLGASGTVGTVGAGSFVDGPMQTTAASTSPVTLVFPIGKGSNYGPVTLVVTQSAATATLYKAEAFAGDHSGLYTFPSTILKVSNARYYVISKGAGSAITAGQVTLSYNANDVGPGGISVSNQYALRIVKDDGAGNWVDLGPATGGTANNSGNITSSLNFTSFSDFAIAESCVPPTVNTPTINNVTCFGAADGSITQNLVGGTTPFTYLWTASGGGILPPGQELVKDPAGLIPGTYSVTITTTAGGCMTTGGPYTIMEPAILNATVNSTDVTCFGSGDGTITITTPTGGSGSYEYRLDAGVWQGSGSFTGLAPGTYSVQIRDAVNTGCEITLNAALTISEPPLVLPPTGTTPQVFCGSATVADLVASGSGIQWYDAAGGGTLLIGATALVDGEHYFATQTVGGCESPSRLDVTVTINAVTGPTSFTTGSTDICFDAADETYTATAANSTSIVYSVLPAEAGVINPGTGVMNWDALFVGTATITATSTGLCGTTSADLEVTVHPQLTATHVKVNVPSCNIPAGGSITVTPAGGAAPYTYSWTGTLVGNIPFTAGDFSALTGLSYGFYNVTVTDAVGCVTTINNIHIENAYAVYVTNNGSISAACASTGSILLYGNAGLQPYTYSLDGTNYQPGNSFTNLAAGDYTAYVMDAAGCVSTKAVTVGVAAPVVVTAYAKGASSCSPDGSIELYRMGGIGPYTYSLDNITYQASNKFLNLAAGTYTGYVKDFYGCIGSLANITVTQGTGLTVTAGKSNTSVCVNDGSFQLRPSGGVGPYTYSMDNINFQASATFLNLGAGSYTGYVKDSKGCSGSVNITIIQNPITVSYFVAAASNCAGSNGSIQLFRTGGVGPYTYSLDGNTYQSSNVFTGLVPGTYDGYVKDSKTCVGVSVGIVVGPIGCPLPPVAGGGQQTRNTSIKWDNANNSLRLTAHPNPSISSFTLVLEGFHAKEKLSITVTDIFGRKVYQVEGTGKQQYTFGSRFIPGIYNVQVIQGKQTRSIQLIKD